MLKQLTLKNFVLVQALDIDFNTGLTTITGESGAGKSILLNALGLLLGERARTEVIRPGSDKADVCAEFDLSHLPHVQAQLTDADLQDDEPNHCLIRRVVTDQGRSRAFVNGIPVTGAFLKSLGEQLVDIYGQHEHLRLANRGTQLRLLDDYAGLNKAALEVANLFRRWQLDLAAVADLEESLSAAADRKDLLSYQLEELAEFDLQGQSFASLEAEHKRLSQAQHTIAVVQSALANLDELDSVRASVREVDSIDDAHSDLQSAQSTLQSVLGLVDDAVRDLRHYQDQVVVDPEMLSLAEDKLNTIQDLARKHRVNPEQLSAHAESLQQELEAIDADSSNLAALQASAAEHQAKFDKKAATLSKKRRQAAPKFSKAISSYMRQLGIKDGAFTVQFEDVVSESGVDRVEFYVTTNADFPAGPLTQIASGGEQTRIGLSIQIVAAQNSALPCLLLDEADVGVGGTTADTVGRILRDLGQHTQVICITHAPQVAALGNNHYRVVKQGKNTNIDCLDDSHRIEELARMLAGADITEKTRDYAQTLLNDARQAVA